MPSLETILKFDKKTFILDLEPRAVLFNGIQSITSIINKNFKVIDGCFYPKDYVSYSTNDMETLKFIATYEETDLEYEDYKVPEHIRTGLITSIYNLAREIYQSGKVFVLEVVKKEVTVNTLKELLGKEISFSEEVQRERFDVTIYLPTLEKEVWFEEYVEWWKHTSLWVEQDPEPSSDGMRNPKRYGPPRVERCVDYYAKIPIIREASFNDVIEMLLRLIDVIYCAKGICEIICYGNFGDTCTLYDDAVKTIIEEVESTMMKETDEETNDEKEKSDKEDVIDFFVVSEYELEDEDYYDPDYVRVYHIKKVGDKLVVRYIEYGEDGENILDEFEISIDKNVFTKDELLQLIKNKR